MNANSTPGQQITSAWRLPLLAYLALHLCASASGQTWHWTDYSSGTAEITSVAHGPGLGFRIVNANGKFVAGRMNGTDWSAALAEKAVGLRDVYWDGSRFVTVGASRNIFRGVNELGSQLSVMGNYNLNGIALGAGYYVAVGASVSARVGKYSSNGNGNWSDKNLNTKAGTVMYGVAFGPRFLAVGSGGAVSRSDDAINWTLGNSRITRDLRAVVYAGGRFVVVGAGGTVLTSPDGINFTANASVPAGLSFTGVAYGAVGGVARYVAVAGNQIYAATDPSASWVNVGTLSGEMNDIAIGDGVVVVVGASGRIRVSSGPLNPTARFSPPGPISQPAVGVKSATVGVTAEPANVNWGWEATVASDPGKMLTLHGATGGKVVKSGIQTLTYDLAVNTADARSARIEIKQAGGSTVLASVTINQAATDRLDVSMLLKRAEGASASYSFTVTPTPAFAWKAVVNPPQNWVTVTPPTTGSGQQTVTVKYDSFTGASAIRSANIEFRRADDKPLAVPVVHTLTQSGLAPPAAAAWGWAPRNAASSSTWVAVQAGTKGWLAHSDSGRVDVSGGGEVGWRTTIAAGTRSPGGAYFDGRNYITVGEDLQIHFSENPEAPEAQWSKKFDKTTPTPKWASGRFSDIAYNGQRYVAVGRVTTASGAASQELIMTSANGGTSWERVDSKTPQSLFGVATYPNGPFVVVGSEGKIRYSSLNGAVWTPLDLGGADFRGVAFGAGRFVAVGLSGKVHYSDDGGVTWKSDAVGMVAGKDLRAVTYGRAGDGVGYFVAVGNGVIQSSVDGASWFAASTDALNLTDIEYRQLADGTGLFVGVGATGAFYSSRGPATGVAFSAPLTQPSGGGTLEVDITAASGSWTAYSPDSWITLENGGGRSGDKLRMTIAALPDGTQAQRTGKVVFNNGTPTSGTLMTIRQNPVARFDATMVSQFSLAGGAGVTLNNALVSVLPPTTDWNVSAGSVPAWLRVEKLSNTSLRYTTLSENATTAPRVTLLEVVYTESGRATAIGTLTVQQLPKHVVPKENWGWVDLTPTNIYSKATKQNLNSQEWIKTNWSAVTHGGRTWVAVSDSGRIATAERLHAGTRWTLHELDSQQSFRDVVWDGSRFGIVGSRRVRFSQDDLVGSFSDPVVNGEDLRFESIAYNAGRYVAVGNSNNTGVIYGADGSTAAKWKSQRIETGKKLWAVEHGAGRFVAVGEDGMVLHSPTGHGRDWVTVPAANRQTKLLRALNYNGRQFLAVGAGGTVSRSTDGTSWTTASPAQGIPADVVLKGVAYGAGFYLAIGETANDRAVPIYASLDGTYWTESSVEKYKLRSISYEVSDYPCSLVPGVFVAVGERGKLIVSYGPGNYNTLTGPTEVQLGSGAGSPGLFYVTALAPWTATLSDAGSGVNWLKLTYPNGTPCQAIEFEAASANATDQPRSVDIVVSTTAGVTPLKVRVTQAAGQVEYEVTPDWRRAPHKGADFDLYFAANRAGVNWAAAARNTPDWLIFGARNTTTGKVKITAKPNPNKECRVGFIDFTVNNTVVASVKVIQYGTDNRCTECETRDLVAK